MRKVEEKRGSRVIALIHRQESMSLLGFPIARYIDIQDSEEIMRAVKMTDPKDPDRHHPAYPRRVGTGGRTDRLRPGQAQGKVTVFIPHYAMSGGTMIALAADEIVMDDNAVLGPVDPQIGEYPAVSILKVLDEKPAKDIDDRTMILADVSRKAIAQVKATIEKIACCQYSDEAAHDLAKNWPAVNGRTIIPSAMRKPKNWV